MTPLNIVFKLGLIQDSDFRLVKFQLNLLDEIGF
jgi:hypothetical protein